MLLAQLSSLTLAVATSLLTPVPQDPDVIWSGPLEQASSTTMKEICFTSSGKVFALEYASSGAAPQYLTSYDESFGFLSRIQVNGPGYQATSICSDGGEGVFVAGGVDSTSSIGGAPIGQTDLLVMQFDGSGSMLWSKRFGGTGTDRSRSVALHVSGDLVVAGATNSSDGFAGSALGTGDGFVMRVTSTGDEVWAHRVGGSQYSSYVADVATGSAGDVFCVGTSDNGWSMYPSGLIARINPSGTIEYQQIAAWSSHFAVAAVGAAGAAVVVGADYQWQAGRITKFRPDGSGEWSDNIVTPLSATVQAVGVVESSPGELLVVANATQQSTPDEIVAMGFSSAGIRSEATFFRPMDTHNGRATSLESDGHGTTIVLGNQTSGHTSLATTVTRLSVRSVGIPGCAGQPNSTGLAAHLQAIGTLEHSVNRLTMAVRDLPPLGVGYFLASTTPGFVANPGGSSGDLCLGGSIGRFRRPGEVVQAGIHGRIHLDLDLDSIPQPWGETAISPGETWWFQAWYRDTGQTATSNLSSSAAVTIQ